MESIAVLSINGHTNYFKNNFTPKQKNQIENIAKQIPSSKKSQTERRISVKLTKIRRSDIFHLINPLISCNVIKTMKFLQRVLSYFSLKHHEIAEIKKKICKFET